MPISFKTYFKFFSLFVLLVLTNFSLAKASDKATIKLKSGEEYKDVVFKVNDAYKTVQFEYQDQKYNKSFSDIESITDESGQDITPRILRENYRPSRNEWLSENSDEIRALRAKPWILLIALGGNYSMPTGNYYKGIESGLGFDGDVRIALSHNIALQFLLSRSGMKAAHNLNLISFDPNLTIIDQDITFHATRYEIAVNYFEPISRVKEPQSFYYIFTGLGAITHTTTIKATVRDNDTGDLGAIDDSHSESKFVMTLGVGGIAMISRNFGFDFSGTADMVTIPAKSGSSNSGIVYAYIFDLKISIIAGF